MGISKQLKPEEYSEDRKKAIREMEVEKDEKKKSDGLINEKNKRKPIQQRKPILRIDVVGEHIVRCIKCGKGYKARDSVWESMLQKYGSIENIKTKHICRFCKKNA